MGKKFQDLDLSNAYLFAAALEDEETCGLVLEIILGIKVPKVKVQAEHSILVSSDFRSVRLDVYATDEMQVHYNMEMQNKDYKNLAKRSRYHQAEMDVSSLKPGEDFSALKPSYVIFICTFDPFDRGLYRYTFEEQCQEEDFSLGDGTKKIFLNTEGKNAEDVPQELIHFLEYVKHSTDAYVATVEEEPIILLHEKVIALKQRRELEGNYMKFEELLQIRGEEGRAEGKIEGRAEGKIEGKIEGRAEGKTEGKAEDILSFLSDVGEVPEVLKEKVMQEQDLEVLQKWLKLAARTESIGEFEKQIQ